MLALLLSATFSAQAQTAPATRPMGSMPPPPPPKLTPADGARRMKADGTPDMRYKENQKMKPAPGPMKKDGAPDMRYKSNTKTKM